MSSPPSTAIARRVGPFGLWFGVLGAPVAWTWHTLLSYFLLYVICGTPWRFLLYAVTVVAVVVAAAAGYVSWRTWRETAAAVRHEPDVVDRQSEARRRFMGLAGLLISVLFGFVTLVVGLTPVILNPCR